MRATTASKCIAYINAISPPLKHRPSSMTINQCAFKLKLARKCLLPSTTNGDEAKLLHIQNRPMPLVQRRGFAFWGKSRTSVCDDPPPEAKKCPSRSCNPPKQSWYDWLFTRKKVAPPSREIPDVRCCRKKYCRQLKHPEPDPDFSEFGGQAYKTCGIAYVIQRDRLQASEPCESKEDRLLRQIETHPELQSRMIVDDPIKDSDNLFSRLVEMSDLKLHPHYKKIAATPLQEGPGTCKHVRPYRALTGPIDHSDLPAQIKINRGHLERKNLYFAHKNVAPPMDFEGRIKETKPRPIHIGWSTCVPTKKTVFDMDMCAMDRVKRDTVFDSLKQKPMDFSGVCKFDDRDRSDMVYHPIVIQHQEIIIKGNQTEKQIKEDI